MSGQILRQVEKFVQCGVKVAEDVTVMAVHMSLSGKPPKVPVNKDMSGLASLVWSAGYKCPAAAGMDTNQ